ncbi:MAG: aquaporin family protein [Gammaproteobacteria bacterium]|nr:aquaporin family protein [Gammaproteobacteria bacterium]
MARKLFSEWLGTFFLVAVVIGSGIMAEGLSGGNVAIALLGNTIATGAILVVIILVFGPLSGAHFNPAVTLAFALRRDIEKSMAVLYVLVQIIGGVSGAIVAHIMFELPLVDASDTVRSGLSQWVAEFVATFGLVATIFGCLKARPEAVPYAVGLFITAGYWFTSSTSFANPAVTIARTMTNTFSGISPADAPAFILAQLIAASVAVMVFGWLLEDTE